MKRLFLFLGLGLVGLSQSQFETREPFQISTLPYQVAGPSYAGDSTICDHNGCEGNFMRIKSRNDFFDLTVWGPDPELGVGWDQPLPPHTLELRDSSNNVIMRYREGTWTFYGKVETRP